MGGREQSYSWVCVCRSGRGNGLVVFFFVLGMGLFTGVFTGMFGMRRYGTVRSKEDYSVLDPTALTINSVCRFPAGAVSFLLTRLYPQQMGYCRTAASKMFIG